jgi:hypothetical protein
MLHGQTEADGSFTFQDVPFNAGTQYAVMATYQDVVYYSEVAPADLETMQTSIEVSVYETTTDPASLQVDEMHVMFTLAPDGLETKEIYVYSSNQNERTVKGVYQLDSGQAATMKFPLPQDADYIFFKPDDQERFVKFNGGFADTFPVAPGAAPAQFMVSYLVPYPGERSYSYTAPVDVMRINFVLPGDTSISLRGEGLAGPEAMTLKSGESFQIYSHTFLKAGQTVNVTIEGGTAGAGAGAVAPSNMKTPLATGIAMLGVLVIGTGTWWWYRGKKSEAMEELEAATDLDGIVDEIASLDQSHANQGIDEQEYQRLRERLLRQAKDLMDHSE